MNSSDLSISAGIKSNKSRCCVLNVFCCILRCIQTFTNITRRKMHRYDAVKIFTRVRQSTCQYGPNPSPNAQPRAKKKRKNLHPPDNQVPRYPQTLSSIQRFFFFFRLPFFAICCRSSVGFSARSLDNRTEEFCTSMELLSFFPALCTGHCTPRLGLFAFRHNTVQTTRTCM